MPDLTYSLDYFEENLISGGAQILDFKNLGYKHTAHASDLLLHHGAHLHITVIATNGAGLKTVWHSTPVTIDKTPPVLCCIVVSQDGDDGVEYLRPGEVTVRWEVADEESGIGQCWYSLGMTICVLFAVYTIQFTK